MPQPQANNFGRERFDAFLHDYFDSHRHQGILPQTTSSRSSENRLMVSRAPKILRV